MDSSIIVSGMPAAGKTTLAESLRDMLGVPLVRLDSIKESLHEAQNGRTSLTSDELGVIAANLVVRLDSDIRPFIFEGFVSDNSVAKPLRALLGPVIEVYCACPIDLCWERFAERALDRRPPHDDQAIDRDFYVRRMLETDAASAVGQWDGVLMVNTSEQVDLEELVVQLRATSASLAFERQRGLIE